MFLVAIFIADIILTNNLLFFSSLNVKHNKINKNIVSSKNILDFNKYDFIKNNIYKSHLPLVTSKKKRYEK